MAPGRSSKTLVSRRRRTKGDDEDDESVTMAGDSQSEASVASDLDGDADADDDADASDMSDDTDTDTTDLMVHGDVGDGPIGDGNNDEARSKRRRKPKKTSKEQSEASAQAVPFATSADTDTMLNGFKNLTTDEPPVDYQDMGLHDSNEGTSSPADTQAGPGRKFVSIADKRRREHEEYKKKRDSDPTFIPNRGGFFMHDARIPEQRGFASLARGRGRGRAFAGASAAQGGPMPQPESALSDTNWKHDLHETVNVSNASSKPYHSSHDSVTAAEHRSRPVPPVQPRPVNFSKTTQIGRVHIRLLLPGSKPPILFSAVPVKSHACLPDHRPPLRRDKPVRISLPDATPRYRFPSSERSFIFIPRAMRPNQQGFGRARGSFGGYGAGPPSRRTSVYGGSVYSPSLSMSRRSSVAREVPRDSAFSPTGSYAGRPPPSTGRPVVRLPYPGSRRSSNASPAGSVGTYGRGQPYPLPQKPAVEHWAESATMYQPRPQKTISVTGIESPAGMSLHAPQQQDQQPFHSQLPQHMAENGMSSQQASIDPAQHTYYSQSYSYPGGMTTGTPLSNIPERAIYAQPFQPVPAFYPQYPAQSSYYPSQGPQYSPMLAYVPPSQSGYAAPGGNVVPGPADSNSSQQGMVAYETNGMVYYQDAAQVPQYPQQDAYYQAPVYGMGGMMTPGPEASNYYYPQVPAGPIYYGQN